MDLSQETKDYALSASIKILKNMLRHNKDFVMFDVGDIFINAGGGNSAIQITDLRVTEAAGHFINAKNYKTYYIDMDEARRIGYDTVTGEFELKSKILTPGTDRKILHTSIFLHNPKKKAKWYKLHKIDKHVSPETASTFSELYDNYIMNYEG